MPAQIIRGIPRTLLIILPLLTTLAMAGPRISIQPLGRVDETDIKTVIAGIQEAYTADVEVLPAKPLPAAAYFKPRNRYKAEEITDFLESKTPVEFTKIVGLTAADISTTRDDGSDWGIMGLGQLGGRACVVSVFRLGKGKVTRAVFESRLRKVINHEIGHTFGADHCPVTGCLMQDKQGKVATVDSETGRPCTRCAVLLPMRRQTR